MDTDANIKTFLGTESVPGSRSEMYQSVKTIFSKLTLCFHLNNRLFSVRFFLLDLLWLETSMRIVLFFDRYGWTDLRMDPGLEEFQGGPRLLIR